MLDQATRLRSLVRMTRNGVPAGRPGVIVVAGGKGGVGGSIVALNLAVAFAEGGRTVLLVDASRTEGGLEVLAGSTVPHPNVRVVAADTPSAALRACSLQAQAAGTQELVDIVIADAGSGGGPDLVEAAMDADVLLVVTSIEVTSILGAYALIKEVAGAGVDAELRCAVNESSSPREAESAAAGLNTAAVHFLRRTVEHIGTIPADGAVKASVAAQVPLVLHDGFSGAALSVRALAVNLLQDLHIAHSRRARTS